VGSRRILDGLLVAIIGLLQVASERENTVA
jgi:hypothetical protein